MLESNLSAASSGQTAGQSFLCPFSFLPSRRPKNAVNSSASPSCTLIWMGIVASHRFPATVAFDPESHHGESAPNPAF
jgi:hypothetical protein